ncbi:MAG: hypothetical protein L3K26_18055, partial [Candidatus Hydrogenedentes bacterium]|nr:hypothetical protein [Candidatus Hydrogenedentota bacterium]
MPSALTVAGLTISEEKGADRAPLDTVSTTLKGIDGDRHAGSGLRQISLVYEGVARHFYPETPPESLPGMGRENILLAAEPIPELRLLDTLEMGDVILEITKISDEVNASAAPQSSVHSRCLLSNYGFFARVVHGGAIKTGQTVRHQHRRATRMHHHNQSHLFQVS